MVQELVTADRQTSLVERVRGGDRSAEDELVALFNRRIETMMLVRTRDAEAARELAQDTMLAVLRGLRDGQLREPEKLAAFVHGTARNLANNFLRARSQEPNRVPISPELAVTNPVEDAESAEQVTLIRNALKHLDSTDRQVLLMILVDGLKPAEIAAQLGLNAELVRQRKSRALKKVIDRVRKMS